MKRVYLAAAILWVSLSFLASPALHPAAAAASVDPMQRYFLIYNELDVPIFPVIQAPQAANCSSLTDLTNLRIYVNAGRKGMGIPKGGVVRVNIPKDKPCAKGGFYNAARVLIFLADVNKFEALLRDGAQKGNDLKVPWAKDICANADDADPACWVALASGPYLPDAPAQLLEYTIISQVGNAQSTKDQNDPDGISVLDFDVSYVDDAYLPVTMAVDGGITAFMGSKLPLDKFQARLAGFLNTPSAQWSGFAAYTPLNYPSAIFSTLVPNRIDKLPSGSSVISLTKRNEKGQISASGYYHYPAPWDGSPQYCQKPGDTTHNQMCVYQNAVGDHCCPAPPNSESGFPGGPLSCCDIDNFIIDKVSRRWILTPDVDPDVPTKNFTPTQNQTLTSLTQRWLAWIDADKRPDCSNPPADTPVVAADKVRFCQAFGRTVNFLYDEFVAKDAKQVDPETGTLNGCAAQGLGPDEFKQCIISSIIGYSIQSGYDPTKCIVDPLHPNTPLPPECGEEKQRNESAQALLRGLPYTGFGSQAECAQCPSLDGSKCPPAVCVIPSTPAPDATVWHYDKFLHFWARYDSVYNLNPFTRFVHNLDEGLAAPGAYSFSIDDFYGNFGGPGTGMIIDVGGTSFLPNKNAYDPYTQYFTGWQFWDHGTVCGRPVSFKNKALGYNYPISFWNGGKKVKTCEVVLFADAAETDYVKYLVTEVGRDPDDPNDRSPQYLVTDSYTGQQHSVLGLSGVFASRGDGVPTPHDQYCLSNSTKAVVNAGKCTGNLSAHGDRLNYVGVKQDPATCPSGLDATCGRPLMNLNIPAWCGPGTPNTCPGLTAPGPLPPTVAVAFDNGKGKAQNVGLAKDSGKLTLTGRFTTQAPIALDRATLTITDLIDEVGGVGELSRIAGGGSLLPLALVARPGSKGTLATFETAPGSRPSVSVEVKRRDVKAGLLEFSIKVDRDSMPVRPIDCTAGSLSYTQLKTRFTLDDGVNQVIEVGATLPWQCKSSDLLTP